jgi:hypothetical protein
VIIAASPDEHDVVLMGERDGDVRRRSTAPRANL